MLYFYNGKIKSYKYITLYYITENVNIHDQPI